MNVFETHIPQQVSSYLKDNLKNITSFEAANQRMYADFGIIHFFDNDADFDLLKANISNSNNTLSESNRAEYGDFQTNENLANQVTLQLVAKNISPEIVVESTCGKGNFIVAALKNFKEIKHIFAIEIYKPYVWAAKFSIIHFFLNNPDTHKPDISITHSDVFDVDFKQIAKQFPRNKILVIGNPPWVTNAQLGSLNSTNLPKKTNFKNHSGLDAMTGKGNFDIAEFITLSMLDAFKNSDGHLMLLIKNSVIKNIVFDQQKNKYPISNIEKHCIDSKKEFNVSVEAALFACKFNSKPEFACQEFNFYTHTEGSKFGWLKDKFVANIDTYFSTKDIDGICPFVWRQGLKHDCSSIMELDKVNGHYVNGLNEVVILEEGLVYGMLKSSDLKNTVIHKTRKFTIVTQKKVGQETKFIKDDYPKTYQYLTDHQSSFDSRKSSIYTNKPAFSIFGIGDYSFKPFKVAISGLYKTAYFTLILPQNNKPVMLDDTCYLIGFDRIEFAVYALMLLNSDTTRQFLESITFPDAKRTFTKDVLMRIDLLELAKRMDKTYLTTELNRLNTLYEFDLTLCSWDVFLDDMTPINKRQIELFA